MAAECEDAYAAEVESSRERLRQSGMVESSTDKDLYKYVRVEHERKPPAKSPSFSVVAATAIAVLGLGTALLRSSKAKALLVLLGVAGASSSAMQSTKGMPYVNVTVHSSDYSRSNCYFNASGKSCRDHGNVDAGSTACTSGRAKLFPVVDQWNPPIRVEIASGVCLPVKARGTMVFKTQELGKTSAKKSVRISAPHSLLVEGMPVTLISPKALFNHCGIRTYYNDELCMILPDKRVVGFYETNTNYTILFEGDDASSVLVTRHPNISIWPWTSSDPTFPVAHRSTLRDPIPLTWDLLHERCGHFSPERIYGSAEFIKGIEISALGPPNRHSKPCLGCVRGAFRGHRHLKRLAEIYTRFCQRVYCDSCVMPKSTPFGFTEMYIFYDACTKLIAVYFGKTTQASEMTHAFLTFVADHKRWMPKGHVEEWYIDGGPEFKSRDQAKICAEMQTRRRFIAPWNPWMNVAETGWRIILRPVRIILAANNVSKALWPFAVQHVVLLHNALSSSSDTAAVSDSVSLATAIVNAMSLVPKKSPPSPFFNVTGKVYDLSKLRVLFCAVECKIRNKDDLRRRTKVDPVTAQGIHLGISPDSWGCMVYLFEYERFTVASHNDVYFQEDVRPRLNRIVGKYDINGRVGPLPSSEQQINDTSGVHVPDLVVPDVTEYAPIAPADPEADDEIGESDEHFSSTQCDTSGCTFPRGHPGNCSTVVDAARTPRVPGLTLRDQTRNRDIANIVAAVEGSGHILSSEHDSQSYMVAIAGDAPLQVAICYNTEAPTIMAGPIEPPKTTHEALNGPDADVWLAAYRRDLAAKINNGTFTYVERPTTKHTIKTKVAHVFKHGDRNDPMIITEHRARWVGLGFMQGPFDTRLTITQPTAPRPPQHPAVHLDASSLCYRYTPPLPTQSKPLPRMPSTSKTCLSSRCQAWKLLETGSVPRSKTLSAYCTSAWKDLNRQATCGRPLTQPSSLPSC